MVFETIRSMLAESIGCDESRIRESTVILEDLEADESDMGELILGLEGEFSISLDEADVGAVRTVGDLVRLVEEQL